MSPYITSEMKNVKAFKCTLLERYFSGSNVNRKHQIKKAQVQKFQFAHKPPAKCAQKIGVIKKHYSLKIYL